MLLRLLTNKKLFSPKSRILLAVSGGLDSVVLAELFYRQNIDFGIALLQLQLARQRLVLMRNLYKKLKVPFHTVSLIQSTFKNKNRIQETARKLRDTIGLKKSEKKFGYEFIATAHQLDDSIETFFINLIRGTELKD